MRFSFKSWVLRAAFSRWDKPCQYEPGYTILLPSPMDMPFLLRLGLEGIRGIDTSNCRQILVVPDGWGDDGGQALREVIDDFDDSRIELVSLRRWDLFWIRRLRPPGSAATHWMLVVNGTRHARCQYAFLHDADAFFLEREGLERQFSQCQERGMWTLGVTPRCDPIFRRQEMDIPGTWELMFSTRWARRQSPYQLKGRRANTPAGESEFDSMLYRQYLDYASGRIGVMNPPPSFVHFNGTIYTYRLYRDGQGSRVVDEFFRLLFLSLLETVVTPDGRRRLLPDVSELALGLHDDHADVGYQSEVCQQQYPVFRRLTSELCDSPSFQGERGDAIKCLLEPFDAHFGWSAESAANLPEPEPELREAGLG